MKNKLNQPVWWLHNTICWSQVVEVVTHLIKHQFRLNISRTEIEQDIRNQQNWQKVIGGLSNYNYQLKIANHYLFVQVVNEKNYALLPEDGYLAVNQFLTKQHKIRDWLRKCWYESKKIRIFDWIIGDEVQAHLFDEPEFVHQMSLFLSQLHHCKIELPSLNIENHLYKYYRKALAHSPESRSRLDSILEEALLLSHDFKTKSLCHNDLSSGNLLYGEKLTVIDWEYVSVGDPLFDLAGICVNFELNEERQNNLILNYSEKNGIKIDLEKLNKMKSLYQLVAKLWNKIQE
ncbi:phosphotransferase [Aliikangiella maris]|uniref:Phosphotransferase n=2 Tax=Aliikangiella maris TaxID=3162458 RepID=A0ABV3MS02_9GAMM